MTRSWRLLAAVLACLSLVAAACGGDDDDGELSGLDALLTQDTLDLTSDATDAPDATAAVGGIDDAVLADLDANGDGLLTLGVATPGPRDDGAYYQALVEAVEEYATGRGWPAPIIVDNISSEDSRPEIEALAQQAPDVIFVGASEIAGPMPELAEQYSDIFWYCSCGAGFESSDWYAQSQDSGAEISFTAGYAAGILMRDDAAPGTVTAFVGGAGYPFETESLLAYEAGLQEAVKGEANAAEYTVQYVQAGNFDDYLADQENGIKGAKAAYDEATQSGNIGAVYPYLGGAHLPVARDANDDGFIVMSAGSSTGCEESPISFTDPSGVEDTVTYDMEVRFDGGDYLEVILEELFSGELLEGDVRYFATGRLETVTRDGQEQQVFLNGAELCSQASPEQVAELEELFRRVADGEFQAIFDAVIAEAYGGG